jgi:putative molybdenum carrier protein
MGTGLTYVNTPERRAAAERDLRVLLRSEPGLTVLTGGQTGVDTFAALAALQAGLSVHQVFPKGYRQEDGQLTTARQREVSGAVLHELSWASFRYRTWTCAYIADAIVLLDPAGGAGCWETAQAARRLGRPLLCPEPGEVTSDHAADWLAETAARVLMVAGCRGSLLASRGKESAVRADLTALMAAARRQHERVTGQG